MKKRLRKKLKLNEFREINLSISLNSESSETYLKDIVYIIEDNGFKFSGNAQKSEIKGTLSKIDYKSQSNENISNIKKFLQKSLIINTFKLD